MAESKDNSNRNNDFILALEISQIRLYLLVDRLVFAKLLEANLRKSQPLLWRCFVDVVSIADDLQVEAGEGQQVEEPGLKVID